VPVPVPEERFGSGMVRIFTTGLALTTGRDAAYSPSCDSRGYQDITKIRVPTRPAIAGPTLQTGHACAGLRPMPLAPAGTPPPQGSGPRHAKGSLWSG
jgi:hypothetical protein